MWQSWYQFLILKSNGVNYLPLITHFFTIKEQLLEISKKWQKVHTYIFCQNFISRLSVYLAGLGCTSHYLVKFWSLYPEIHLASKDKVVDFMSTNISYHMPTFKSQRTHCEAGASTKVALMCFSALARFYSTLLVPREFFESRCVIPNVSGHQTYNFVFGCEMKFCFQTSKYHQIVSSA